MRIPVWLIVLAVILLLIVILVLVIIKKVERFSRSIFGTRSLTQGILKQKEELARTPKSVAGMTRIYEPQLMKDFPEFNWKEFRQKAEQMLVLYLAAISKGQEQLIGGGSLALRQQLLTRISENKRQQITEQYQDVVIHNTEITRYERKQGTCVLTLQSAVGHIHYKEKNKLLVEGDRTLPVQTRYNTQLMYVQDANAANLDKAVGVTCPSCGAPVTGLGRKKCEYCGLEVTPINVQVWSIQGFHEVNYHNV